MDVFSQYNIQFYCTTVVYLVSTISTIAPLQIRITKGRKAFYVLLPFFSNLVQVMYIIVYVYLKDKDNNASKKWIELGLKHFITETDMMPFVRHILIISIVLMIVMFVIISVMKRTNFNDKQLTSYYLKLTDKQKCSDQITIIGGSMDFLGVRPCKKISMKSIVCDRAYCRTNIVLKILGRLLGEEKCKKCCLNNEQWIQLSELVNKGCKIQIVCKHSDNIESETHTKEFLGFILKVWKRKNNIEIKFFKDGDPYVRGRIIEDYDSVKQACWNFKTNNRQRSYETPYIYKKNERMGAFVIDAFDNIYELAIPIKADEEQEYIRSFDNRDTETNIE